MADRTVVARLVADVVQYRAAMKAAAKDTEGVGDSAKKTARKQDEALRNMGRGAQVMGAAMLAGAGVAAKVAADFDKSMSGVGAVANASAQDMDKLRQAALKAGADTVYSASQAAQAEAELVKAGVSVSDVLGGGLRGSLDLAAAGQLDLAEAATISAQAMNIFKLQGKDVSHIADVLAAGANKSAADVGQLGDALRQGGLLAKQTGLNLEDTVGILSAFADNALIGSDAGTSLKTMLQRLTPQSQEAAALMKTLGISAYDASGNFIGLAEFADNLRESMHDLTPEQRNTAMATIFGSDAVRAANILYDLGAEGVRDYTKAVNDNGAAQRMAAKQLDNLAGDVEQLRGSIETALIKSGSKANGMLRAMTQSATDAVNVYADLPGPVQAGATAFAALGGAALLAGGTVITLIPKIQATNTALAAMNSSIQINRASVAGLAGSAVKIGVLGAAIYGVAEASSALDRHLGPVPPKIDQLSTALSKYAATQQLSGEATRLFGNDLEDFGERLRRVTDPSVNQRLKDIGTNWPAKYFVTTDLEDARRKIDAVDKALADLVKNGRADLAATAFARFNAEANIAGVSTDKFTSMMDDYQVALDSAAVAADTAADGTVKVGMAADTAAGQVDSLTDAQKDLQKTLIDFVTLSGVYDTVLQSAEDAARKRAEAAADAHNKALDSQVKAQGAATDASIKAINKEADAQIAALRKSKGDHDKQIKAIRDRRDAAVDALRSERDATVSSLKDQKGAWQDYAAGVKVSVADYIAELEKQVAAQTNWQKNLIILSGKLSAGTLMALTEMGEKGAPLVAELVKSSDAELKKLDGLFAADAKNASESVTRTLTDAAPVIAAAAAQGGKKAAEKLAGELAAGKTTVEQAANRLGIGIAQGVGRGADGAVRSIGKVSGAVQKLDRMSAEVDIRAKDYASRTIDNVRRMLAGLPETVPITVLVELENSIVASKGRQQTADTPGRAEGGLIAGPGTGTSDSILMYGSNGEYMQRAAAVDYYGVPFMNALNSMAIPKEALPRFASGGLVGAGPSVTYGGSSTSSTTVSMPIQVVTARDPEAAAARTAQRVANKLWEKGVI